MAAGRQEWLQLTVEAPLDPALPICDPHHHFWNRPGEEYLLGELLHDVHSGHNIVSTVFIECREMWRRYGPEGVEADWRDGIRGGGRQPEQEAWRDCGRGRHCWIR
jgi:hypothetical protein